MTRVRIITSLPASPGPSDGLEWRFPPDLESEITTLAALCQVRQQQREPIAPHTQEGEDDVDNPTEDEECTAFLSSLSLDDYTEDKRGFLDRLAELLCYSKDPTLITGTALIYSDEEATIVAARNSSSSGDTWSRRDRKMLEYLAEVLERVSSDDAFESDPLPLLQSTSVEYYTQRIRHHAKTVTSIEEGKTELKFFKEDGCVGVASGRLDAYQFAKSVEVLSHSTDFYAKLKANLTPTKLRRVVDELAFIRRPMQDAVELLLIAQRYSGFRNLKIVLLNSLPARKVKAWQLPKADISLTARQKAKFHKTAKKNKNVHAEMMLMTYLLGLGSPVFPYLGISKKTCLLCGHVLEKIGQFETRGNHGKCYSQWTLPSALWTTPEATEKLDKAVQRLRDILREEATEEVPHRDAEKESVMAAPIPPRYGKETTVFNAVVEDPRLLAREAEWISAFRRSEIEVGTTSSEDECPAIFDSRHDRASAPRGDTEGSKTANPTACLSCKETGELTHTCTKCGIAAYCNIACYHADWYRHKFSCNLGRATDATDYLVLACHTNQYPQEDDVAEQYGFMCFATGKDRSRLFELYRRLIMQWAIDEEELRAAVKQNKLKEMLTFRCRQTGDSGMLSDKQWLESQEGFGVNGKRKRLITVFEAAREELLSSDERKLPFSELQPPEKRNALLFYVQIRNGFKPDVDEDNWISLGFCTAPDAVSENRLCSAYESLVERCTFNEFWSSMAESGIVELFSKYELADRILRMRNFKDFMTVVKKWHQSVWELKRFIRMDVPDPFRAVVVDYGFMNCKDARQRMQLRRMYQEFFERGEDEMRLHQACVAGKLASFLQSVFGGLLVPPDCLRNPYPLENRPLMGMVTNSVTMCPESALEQVRALAAAQGRESMIIAIPDAEDEAYLHFLHDRAAFLGTGLSKRIYSGSGGRNITEFTL
ncbi:uncharacterized protein E0L32_010855 [Thyridium curvatum]|uniref:MYND-type domain-containing protein n=1 Tax=Thyridium curvatum TaxID=1093900 RepID=A0A507AQY0_9PEZI|nr:uncharacterized protein E0L32_010855 [Thyridium curvatum]TPX07261.1 hypothetical protein E0L32_010855 [Thyridium curvatum]